jgi:O-methyltransferase involved in polyketide biosynthesis
LRARAGGPALAVITIRARFFGDFLQRVTAAEAVGQVVLVAAGLDTRAYRLAWPVRFGSLSSTSPGPRSQAERS